jgi:carboxylesterase type B
VAAASWEAVADAVVAPAACPQPPPSPITPLELNRTSEDCLYLNIFAPEITVIKKLHFLTFLLEDCLKRTTFYF